MTHSAVGIYSSYHHPALAIVAESVIHIDCSDPTSFALVDDSGTQRVSSVTSLTGPTRVFAQGTMGNRPAYVSGRYMLFNDTRQDYLSLAETSGLNWANGTLLVAYKPIDTAANKHVFCVGDGTTARLEFTLNANERPRVQIHATVSQADAQISGVGSAVRTVSIGHWQDGVSATMESTSGTTAVDTTYSTPTLTYTSLLIGRRADGTRPLAVELNELIYWDTRRSAGDLAYLFQYFPGKWV